ncbi:WhiB family transcriptional regulator [Streptomyces antimycoticus]|uniref:WhiB family transcriptional regulator n=1 Tax=Streptomyces antimycoticus TaxID=68175 RepID=UPI0036A7FF3D
MDSATAYLELTEHRHYQYRGCAPVPADIADFPGQALGDPALSIDAWSTPDRAEGDMEPQKVRIARERRAAAACGGCPVLAQCRAYANAETPGGRLAEPDGIWGGQLALDRHRALIKRRTAAPAAAGVVEDVPEARTAQKQAVLRALARETDEELVAYRAGMDVRTANWHRSLLCGLLGLDKDTATRQQLLNTARRLNLLPKGIRIRPDGRWPIVAAPSGDGVRQRRIAPDMPCQVVLPGYQHLPRTTPSSPAAGPTRASGDGARRGLRLVRPAAVQLPLFTDPGAVAVLGRAA